MKDAAGTYSLTDAGRALIEAARKKSRDWLSVWNRVERSLGATRGPEDAPQYEDERFPYPQVTDEVVADADRVYRAEFAKMLAEIEARDP